MQAESPWTYGHSLSEGADGGLHLNFPSPSTESDKRRFEEELSLALAYAETHRCVVFWMHNGILVSTSMECQPGGAWGHFTELSGERAN